MNRRLTLTTGIVLSALSLLYLGSSAYRARAPFKVDTLRNLHGLTLGQVDTPESMVVLTDYRCPHCRTFEGQVIPEAESLVANGDLSFTVVPIGMLGETRNLPRRPHSARQGRERQRFQPYMKRFFRDARREPRGAGQAGR